MNMMMSSTPVDLPTCREHSKETAGTVMGTGRRGREEGKQCDDSSSGHLGRLYKPYFRRAAEVVRTIPNLRPILSEIQPKMSIPTMVPAKATLVNVLL